MLRTTSPPGTIRQHNGIDKKHGLTTGGHGRHRGSDHHLIGALGTNQTDRRDAAASALT